VGRYLRYARQVERLLAKRGKKWKKIESVRRRQRRLMLVLLRRPPAQLSQALRRVQPYVLTECDEAALVEYEEGACAKIYVHVHPTIKSAY